MCRKVRPYLLFISEPCATIGITSFRDAFQHVAVFDADREDADPTMWLLAVYRQLAGRCCPDAVRVVKVCLSVSK